MLACLFLHSQQFHVQGDNIANTWASSWIPLSCLKVWTIYGSKALTSLLRPKGISSAKVVATISASCQSSLPLASVPSATLRTCHLAMPRCRWANFASTFAAVCAVSWLRSHANYKCHSNCNKFEYTLWLQQISTLHSRHKRSNVVRCKWFAKCLPAFDFVFLYLFISFIYLLLYFASCSAAANYATSRLWHTFAANLPQSCKWRQCCELSALHFDFICIEMKTFHPKRPDRSLQSVEMTARLEQHSHTHTVALTLTHSHTHSATAHNTQLYWNRQIGPVSLGFCFCSLFLLLFLLLFCFFLHKQNGGHCNCCRGCTFSTPYAAAAALPVQLCHSFVGCTHPQTEANTHRYRDTHTHTLASAVCCRHSWLRRPAGKRMLRNEMHFPHADTLTQHCTWVSALSRVPAHSLSLSLLVHLDSLPSLALQGSPSLRPCAKAHFRSHSPHFSHVAARSDAVRRRWNYGTCLHTDAQRAVLCMQFVAASCDANVSAGVADVVVKGKLQRYFIVCRE